MAIPNSSSLHASLNAKYLSVTELNSALGISDEQEWDTNIPTELSWGSLTLERLKLSNLKK